MLWLTKVFNVSNTELNNFLKILSPEEAFKATSDELKEFYN